MSTNEKGVILAALKPMFDEARAKGLWFLSGYQELWFSPDELDMAQASGRFIWGPQNWRLYPPSNHLKQLQNRAAAAQREVEEFEQRMR